MQQFRAHLNMGSLVMSITIMILGLTCFCDAVVIPVTPSNTISMPVNFTDNMHNLIDQLAQALSTIHNCTRPDIANFSGFHPHEPYHPGVNHTGMNSTHPQNITDHDTNTQELKSTLFLAYNALRSLKAITSDKLESTIRSADALAPRSEDTNANTDVDAVPTTLSTVEAKPSPASKKVGTESGEYNRYAFNCSYDRVFSTWCMQEQGWYCTAQGAKKRKAGTGTFGGYICEEMCTCTLMATAATEYCPFSRDVGIICV